MMILLLVYSLQTTDKKCFVSELIYLILSLVRVIIKRKKKKKHNLNTFQQFIMFSMD